MLKSVLEKAASAWNVGNHGEIVPDFAGGADEYYDNFGPRDLQLETAYAFKAGAKWALKFIRNQGVGFYGDSHNVPALYIKGLCEIDETETKEK